MARRYIDGPFGQIHVHETPAPAATRPPLICLHPAPYSGLSFATLAPLCASEGRTIIAPDYPGYGASDPTPDEPNIADYAAAMLAVADDVAAERPVDLMGFHTGCLVAVEAAITRPERVRRIVLIDVPYFDTDERAPLRDKMGAPKNLSWELDKTLGEPWSFNVTTRREQLSLERAYELFVEHARSAGTMNAAFRAAFSYPCEERFAKVRTPCTIVATKSGLLEPTRKAAKRLSNAQLVERLDIAGAVLERGASAIADELSVALDAPPGVGP